MFIRILFIICLFNITVSTRADSIHFTSEEQKWIEAHPEVQFGYEPHWPPFEIYKNGKYSGIVGDYIKIIEEKTGIDLQPIPDIQWEETLEKLRAGEIIATGCAAITDERKEYLNFTQPYISSPLVIVTRKNYKFIRGLKDLKNHQIALPVNYYTSELIRRDFPEIDIKHTQSVKEALELLNTGKVDAFVGNLVVISYYISTEGFANLKIAAPSDYAKAHIGFAAIKEHPELVNIVQKVFDSMSDKEHSKILQKWIHVRYEHRITPKQIVLYGGILLAVIIVILVWNASLAREIKKRQKAESKLAASLEEIQKKNKQIRSMLQEIHHRVKNNLQVVVSLLRLQGEKATSESSREMFKESENRVASMGILHEKLYRSENLQDIGLKPYVDTLAQELIDNASLSDTEITYSSDIEDVQLNSKSLAPLGLIVNELLYNSLKHAFAGKKTGEITINAGIISEKEKKYFMEIGDDGIGVDKDILSKDLSSMGMELVKLFAEQLEGKIELKAVSQGTCFRIDFYEI